MAERKVMVNIEIGVGVPESALEGMDWSNLGFDNLMSILQSALAVEGGMGVYYNNQIGKPEYEDEVMR
jgi:hypothetical protein